MEQPQPRTAELYLSKLIQMQTVSLLIIIHFTLLEIFVNSMFPFRYLIVIIVFIIFRNFCKLLIIELFHLDIFLLIEFCISVVHVNIIILFILRATCILSRDIKCYPL